MPKDTPENKVKEAIKLELKKYPALRLFSNPRGTMKAGNRFVSYGLAPGSKDLASADFIGWRTITITENMVGKEIAQFISLEAKAEGGKISEAQQNWFDLVNRKGGFAVISEDAQMALDDLSSINHLS
jgi:hypothetical protein